MRTPKRQRRSLFPFHPALRSTFGTVAEGLELGAYRFTKYLTGDRAPKAALSGVTIGAAAKLRPNAKALVALGQKVGAAVNLARDLSNEPGNVIYPETFAAAAEKVAKAAGLPIQVFDFKEIRRRGMKLIDAVGRGSSREPRFVHISWTPRGAKRKLAVFVGKGHHVRQRGDQHQARGRDGRDETRHERRGERRRVDGGRCGHQAQGGEVHAIAACAENMPDGNAYRPGDVFWGSLDGKTVEIVNTDAEGRLVLADALAYARSLSPDIIVDNATLTGACVVALGTTCAGWYSNDEGAAREFSRALADSGEQMWRMPLLEELREQIKSDVADLKQAGDRYGGSITAALFLREFAGAGAWVHCDIAGPASIDRPHWTWMLSKGATGHGVAQFPGHD